MRLNFVIQCGELEQDRSVYQAAEGNCTIDVVSFEHLLLLFCSVHLKFAERRFRIFFLKGLGSEFEVRILMIMRAGGG